MEGELNYGKNIEDYLKVIKRGEQMLVRNKWNNKMYEALEITDKNVTLQREDGSQFTIQKSEYFFSYSEKK